LIGKVVSVRAINTNGTYSTHLLLPKQSLIVWPEGTEPLDVACSITNPMSAIGLRATVQKLGYSNVLLSAANSALNHMMIKYLKSYNMKVYGIVRNPDQVEELVKLGADKIWVGYED
jgi:NADPH2:quinone reductase